MCSGWHLGDEALTSSHERAKLLVLGLRIQHVRKEWFAIAKARALAACGQNFEARDVIVSWLKENVPRT